ncbi:hypothetical protein GGQ68_002498 [Sagittula marina]|uniref:Uncharacterized protein n=1 Tax=Sagittula marina TaxID=943940 RepID=A0A7W6DSZ5_9RHOB|nr:hypothetical protein [Sagittula marina]MBB3986160.1 hypothetical protein [Sagittula marina]
MSVVDANTSPEQYPEELCDPELARNYFVMWHHRRWLSSRLCLTASLAVQGAAQNLFWLSQEQNPIGSLPSDHVLLARLLRITDHEWNGLMAEAVTPLHGWQQYIYGNEILLGHPVVIEVACNAAAKREERKLSNQGRSVNKRRERLAESMGEIGCSAKVCQDAHLVAWLDGWLVENHPGQRRRPAIESSIQRGLEAAHRAGLFGKS